MKFNRDYLVSKTRKELQSYAKNWGLKANASSENIINAILQLSPDDELSTPEGYSRYSRNAIDISSADSDAVACNLTTSVINNSSTVQVEKDPQLSEADRLAEESRRLAEEKANQEFEAKRKEFMGDAYDWIPLAGQDAEAEIKNIWMAVKIIKMNHVTYRVALKSDGSERLVNFEKVRKVGVSTPSAVLDSPSQSTPFSAPKARRSHTVVPEVVEILKLGEVADDIEPVVILPKSEDVAVAASSPLKRKRSASSSEPVIPSEQPAWNSAKKVSQQVATVQERKKSISTPIKTAARPSILPKSTKTQRMRQEALLGKRGRRETSAVEVPSAASSSSSVATSSSAVATKAVSRKSTTAITRNFATASKSTDSQSKPSASSSSSVAPKAAASAPVTIAPSPLSTPSKKSTVPDFQKMHQRMMSNLKPITEMVKRNETVDIKMSVAMSEAHKSTPSTFTAFSGTSSSKVPATASQHKPSRLPIRSAVSSAAKGTSSSVAPSSAPFKARTMPNFKAIHGKIPQSGLPSADKENVSAAAGNVIDAKARQSVKGAKLSFVETKKENRKESFLQKGKTSRSEAIESSRKSGPFTSTA